MKKTTFKYTLLLLAGTAVIAMLTCLLQFPITQYIEKNAYEEIKDQTIPRNSDELIVTLYAQGMLELLQQSESPYHILIDESKLDPEEHDLDYLPDYVESFLQRNWNSWFRNDASALSYSLLLKDQEKESEFTNQPNLRETDMEDGDYLWYVRFSFDENGVVSISELSDTIQTYDYMERLKTAQYHYVQEYLYDLYNEAEQESMQEDPSLQLLPAAYRPIKNADYIIAVPKDISVYDYLFYHQIANPMAVSFQISALLFLGALGLWTIFCLLFPLSYAKTMKGFRAFLHIPLEAHLFFDMILLSIGIAGTIAIPQFYETNLLQIGTNWETPFLIAINGCVFLYVWTSLLAVFLFIQHLKQIKEKGWGSYCKHHILITSLLCKFYRKLCSVDIHNRGVQYIIIFLLINFLFDFFLIRYNTFTHPNIPFMLVVLLYHGFLGYLALHTYRQYQRNYEDMRDALHEIETGQFDAQPIKDLGIYQSMNDSIVSIRDGFSKAVADEVKSQKMKTELITNVSHDLKTPLTSIVSYVDLLKNTDATEAEKQAYLDTLEVNASRLKHLIEDLFEVSKASSGAIVLHPIRLDLNELLNQLLVEYRDTLADKQLDVRFQSDADKQYAFLDPQKTYRIFANLLGNIGKYALPNSRVYIEVRETDQITVTFRNISEKEIHFRADEIIERFVRGDSSRNSEGSGLGLSIVQSFVQLQGGTFHIEIDGDLFKAIVHFPLFQSEEEQAED